MISPHGRCTCGHSKTSHHLSEGVCEIWKCKCEKYEELTGFSVVDLKEIVTALKSGEYDSGKGSPVPIENGCYGLDPASVAKKLRVAIGPPRCSHGAREINMNCVQCREKEIVVAPEEAEGAADISRYFFRNGATLEVKTDPGATKFEGLPSGGLVYFYGTKVVSDVHDEDAE